MSPSDFKPSLSSFEEFLNFIRPHRFEVSQAATESYTRGADDDLQAKKPGQYSHRSSTAERASSLHEQRLQTVLSALKDTGAKRVVDLGCGEGNLLRLPLTEKQFETIPGMDVSWIA